MEFVSCLAIIAFLGVFIVNGVVCEGPTHRDEGLHKTLVKRLDNIQQQLAEVSKSVRSLDQDLDQALFDAGLWSDLTPLRRPQKRSVPDDLQRNRLGGYYRDLVRKRAMVDHLLEVLKGADNVLKTERKRSCDVNLGFHCDTQEISDFVDQYNFLASDESPGKKKRAVSVALLPMNRGRRLTRA